MASASTAIPTRAEPNARVGIWAGAIAVGALAAYSRTFSSPFLFDDVGSIATNPTLRHWSTAFFPPAGGMPVSGRPVVNASLALNYAISGTATWSYHALNLVIHVLAGWVLLGLARRTLRLIGYAERRSTRLAFAIALLWTLHPIQTESVTYLSQRAESLMGLLFFAALYAFIRAFGGARCPQRAEPTGGSGVASGQSQRVGDNALHSRTSWAVICILFAALGMATKEVMVTIPVIILLYDRTFLAGSFAAAWKLRGKFYGVLACTWIPLACLVATGGGRGNTAGFHSSVVWWAYSFSQIRAVMDYFRLSLWPRPLAFDYGLVLGGPRLEMIADAIGLAVLVAGTIWLLVKRPAWGFLGAWFFIILSPSSSVVPVATEIEAEHRVYLSLAAIVGAVVLGLDRVLDYWSSHTPSARRLARIGGGLLLGAAAVVLGVSTLVRNRAYASVLAFWQDAAEKRPDSAGARNNYGNALAEQGRAADAAAEYEAALRLEPSFEDPHENLANLLTKQGRWDEAAVHYRAALRSRAENADLHYLLGHALTKTGRSAEALQEYDLALAGSSPNAVIWYNLGNDLLDLGDSRQAAVAFGRAVQIKPDYADALLNYAGSLAQSGQIPPAITALQSLLRLQPEAADVHNNLGGMLAESGQLKEAKAQFEAALKLKPDYREARDNLQRVEYLERSGTR